MQIEGSVGDISNPLLHFHVQSSGLSHAAFDGSVSVHCIQRVAFDGIFAVPGLQQTPPLETLSVSTIRSVTSNIMEDAGEPTNS